MSEPSDLTAPPVATPVGFWADVREALRGSEHDYTKGPIGRSILLLSIPMVLEMALESNKSGCSVVCDWSTEP